MRSSFVILKLKNHVRCDNGNYNLMYSLLCKSCSSSKISVFSYNDCVPTNSFAGSGRRLKELMLRSDNCICADCGAPDPKWA